jgi:hypothetical protein
VDGVNPPAWATLVDSRVAANGGGGIVVLAQGRATCDSCWILDNGGVFDVEVRTSVFDCTMMEFEHCYWGPATTAEMIAEGMFSEIGRIGDWWDDAGRSLVVYDDFLAVDAPAESVPAGRRAVARGYPNPFRDDVWIVLEAPADRVSRVGTVRIYDAGGRLVRELACSPPSAGVRSAVWDGLTSSGVLATAGLYFCRFDEGGVHGAVRIVRLR